MPPFERHIFICCNQREPGHPRGCCDPDARGSLQKAFKKALALRGLNKRVRANRSGCLDQCEHGPTVVVYPDASGTARDRKRTSTRSSISHIVGGEPVARLRLPDDVRQYADVCPQTAPEHRRRRRPRPAQHSGTFRHPAPYMFDAFLTTDGLIALVTLTFLEIVLGVDNVIFISILSGKLPADQQMRARRMGLLAAMVMRILLLVSIAWIIRLTAPLFTVFGHEISGRDLILIGGGLFLLGKATLEIHDGWRARKGTSSARVAPVVCRGDRPDHAARHRLLARFGDHGRRDGRRHVDHGGGRRRRGRRS